MKDLVMLTNKINQTKEREAQKKLKAARGGKNAFGATRKQPRFNKPQMYDQHVAQRVNSEAAARASRAKTAEERRQRLLAETNNVKVEKASDVQLADHERRCIDGEVQAIVIDNSSAMMKAG